MNSVEHRKQLVGVYERVTSIIWQRLAPTFGIRTVNAIARNVIVRSAKQQPALGLIKVGDDGLDWSGFEAQLADMDDEKVRQMLDGFLDEFFDALASLIGNLVMGKIFKEAEEMVRRGGSE